MTPFQLPRGATGFNIDDPPGERAARRDAFIAWSRALADAHGSTASNVESLGNFDVVELETLALWLLQNRFLPLAGVIAQPPAAGFAYAVDTSFVDSPSIPIHLIGWGPTLVPPVVLNRELTSDDWHEFSPPARAHADRFKPTTIGHVLFNYWD